MHERVRRTLMWLKETKANTAEDTNNRLMWWLLGILVFMILAGVVYFVGAHMASQGQSGASSITQSMSSQQGLTQLAQQAEQGQVQGGTSSVGTGGYKAP